MGEDRRRIIRPARQAKVDLRDGTVPVVGEECGHLILEQLGQNARLVPAYQHGNRLRPQRRSRCRIVPDPLSDLP
jgi:hypothetical protein